MTSECKDKLVSEIRQAIREDFPELDPVGSCLYSSIYTIFFLARQGIKAQLQAGSMSWRFVKPELDDGVQATCFSFEWSPCDLPSLIQIVLGQMPEMHVWVATEEKELIDINTSQIPKFLEQSHLNQQWSADLPPDYLWVHVDEYPKWADKCRYQPVMQATRWAQRAASVVLGNNSEVIIKRFQHG